MNIRTESATNTNKLHSVFSFTDGRRNDLHVFTAFRRFQ